MTRVLKRLGVCAGTLTAGSVLLLTACVHWERTVRPAAPVSSATAARVDFNAHIRPILNQNCTACHGGVKAAGEISFVYREAAAKVGKKSGRRVIVAGKPEESELIARVSSEDKEYRMPPADHGAALPPEKIALLREWIKQGAEWQDHWAFVPPRNPEVPEGRDARPVRLRPGEPPGPAVRGPIDAFVRARLAKEGLTPAPEASRPALLRRVSLDLIGLPPTPAEIVAFVTDTAADAYEKQVDRLLASPHFGERWASLWLDLARYADTKGYEADRERTVWGYRDWLVDALNRNLPYDQFIVEQLAGDLLPNATMAQHIATSFHRQTQVNDEGGTDDEEYRTAAVVDRVSTTWQVLNAVTFGCVQCHAHPYDPIRHADYYAFLAFLNGTRDADFNNDYPTLHVPDDAGRRDEAWRLSREIEGLRRDVIAAGKALESDSAPWAVLPITEARATPDANLAVRDGMLFAEGTVATGTRYAITVPVPPATPITALRFEAPPENQDSARHTPERGFIVTRINIALHHPDGRVVPLTVGRFFPDSYSLETTTTKPLPRAKPQEQPAAEPVGANLFANAAAPAGPEESQINLLLPRTANPPEQAAQNDATPRKANAASAKKKKSAGASPPATGRDELARAPAPTPESAPKPRPDDMRDVTLDFHFAANPTLNRPRWMVAALREPLAAPAGAKLHITIEHGRVITSKPAPVQRLRVAGSSDPRWNALATDPAIARKAERVTEALAELAKIPGIELPITAELPPGEGRETRLFARGNFLDKTGAAIAPGVPALFPALPVNQPANRLTLARWFFQPGQPLTARVAVNRFWEQLFETGIVATVEDFGSAGEPPSHPELLDWLALRFERELRWDMKALLRELVTSATYRQDARVTPAQFEKDPRNRLLARGPRQRLTAEMVRDQALAASGLLSRKMGGPPVMPPQPAGVWQSVYNNKDWVESKGEDRHRRAVYTFWKRSAAYPGFLTFDMPARDLCTVRRTPTNTPLQALVTLNDVVFHEAAGALAERARREVSGERSSDENNASAPPDAWIARAFERVVSRPPTVAEAARLRRLYDESVAASDGAAAPPPRSSDEQRGEGAASPDDSRETRALSAVAAAILNLDAAFVR